MSAPLRLPVLAQNSEGPRKVFAPLPYRRGHDHDSFHRRFLLGFRRRRRASLELELIALRHQVSVMRRQRPGRLRLFSTHRLLWWLRLLPAGADCRVGLAPTGKRRLFTAHTQCRPGHRAQSGCVAVLVAHNCRPHSGLASSCGNSPTCSQALA
jgi:hypothetical protein